MKEQVLITGADGFIGSHLTEYLVRQGYKVRAMVLYNSFNSWGWLDQSTQDIKDSIEVVSGDVRDFQSVKEAMRNCDKVFHLAALIAIPYSYKAPYSYIDTNVQGTLNVVQAGKELGTKKIVHTSTSEVYGTAQFVPITEEHPLNGQSPYSASKIGADQMAHSYFCSFETPVAIARPFNTYGPRQSARAVIPTIVAQIASGKKEIKLGSLTPTRDLSYVEDTVSGMLAIAKSDQSVGEVINIGSNFEISIGELAEIIADLMGAKVEILHDSKRIRPKNSEVERLFSCNQKIKKLTDWNPDHAGIEGLKKGLSKTIEWFQNKKNLKLYRSDQYVI